MPQIGVLGFFDSLSSNVNYFRDRKVHVSTNKLHSTAGEIYCKLPFVIYTSLSRYSGGLERQETWTFTKNVTVSVSPEDYNIPNVLLNTSPFLPHNTSGMLKSVLQKWGLTHLQDLKEMMAVNLRRIEVGC